VQCAFFFAMKYVGHNVIAIKLVEVRQPSVLFWLMAMGLFD
jgi:hypothetical protein